MKQHLLSKLILFPALSALLFVACTREKPEDTQSPAYHIFQSEKLVIPEPVDLPANLPAGNTRIATFYAVGVQKYKAQLKPGSTPAEYMWAFVAPQATLYDAHNKMVGTHSAGPTWQLYGATDSIYGQAFTPARSAPSPDAGAIDWLQLMPKSGKTTTGIFANVSYIQRIATKGGKAPATAPTNGDETVNVNYTAVYRFTKAN